MDFEKIITRLNEILIKSETIKNNFNKANEDIAQELVDELDRIVSRTYSDPDKKVLLNDLHSTLIIWTGSPDESLKSYNIRIKKIQRTCNKIIKEYELFGFENFTPIKETINESEKKVSIGKLGDFGWKSKNRKK